ncbi:S-methyl-5'-thioadenosine phosphorylase [subsurface metagenome]
MTTLPEATLAREAKICYATLCLVTNYGAGMQETVSHEEVVEVFRENINVIQRVLKNTITHSFKEPLCNCRK